MNSMPPGCVRAALRADCDERADGRECDSEDDGESPPPRKHLAQRLTRVAGPRHEQPHDRRDVQRVVEVALKLELVGHDERDKKRDGHAADEPGEVTPSADRIGSRRLGRGRFSPRVNR